MDMDKFQSGFFSRLDVILRPLLTSIEKLQTQLQRAGNSSTVKKSGGAEELLVTYKEQCELLKQLRGALASPNENGHDNNHDEKKDIAIVSADMDPAFHGSPLTSETISASAIGVIHQMQKYILLPIIVILQRRGRKCPINDYSADRHNSIYARELAWRNVHRRCIEEAALSLKMFTNILHQHHYDFDHDFEHRHRQESSDMQKEVTGPALDDSDYEACNTTIEVNLRIRCIVALTESLTEVIQSQKHQSYDCSNLDNGDECIRALASCMEVLCIEPISKSITSLINKSEDDKGDDHNEIKVKFECDHEFVLAIQSSMNGYLLFQMVQCCLSVFDDENLADCTTRNRSDKQPLNFGIGDGHKPVNIKGNAILKLQALNTLQSLLRLGQNRDVGVAEKSSVERGEMTITEMWRTMFPGVFKSLCQESLMQLRFATSQSSSRVAGTCLRTLSILLNRTLTITYEGCNKFIVDTSLSAMLIAATSLDSCESKSQSSSCSHELSTFLRNVYKSIPRPLIFILNLIPVNRSVHSRIAGIVYLCDSILIRTRNSWKLTSTSTREGDEGIRLDNVGTEMETAALECVIAMSVDDNDEICRICDDVVRKYQIKIGYSQWAKRTKETIFPRVLSLVERLPSLAKSGRELELSSAMKLINGYLATLKKTEKKNSHFGNIVLRNLAHRLTESDLRQCFVDLFAVDNTKASSKLSQYEGRSRKGSYEVRYRYMRGKTVNDAYDMLHKLALVLGYRSSVLFVDECISILFEDLNTRISRKRSSSDSEHSRWLEKKIGLAVISKEMLKAFDQKRHKKQAKIMKSFASSVIPIICSDLLWYLPTSPAWHLLKSKDCVSRKLDRPPSATMQSLAPLSSGEKLVKHPHCELNISTDALNGNGSLIICFMDLVSCFAVNLNLDFNSFVPLLLYPLVQKTCNLNSPSVQDAAFICLKDVSKAIGQPSLEGLLLANYSYLMETLISELGIQRSTEEDLQSQVVCFYSLHNIVELMLNNKNDPGQGGEEMETKLLLLTDLQSSLTRWFNRQFKRSTRDLSHGVMIPMGLVSIFISITTHLSEIISLFDSPKPRKIGLDSYQFRWQDLLLEFEEGNEHESISFDQTSGKINEERGGCTSKITLSSHTLGRIVHDLEQILITNSTFLSIPDLKIQRKSCELFNAAFTLFAEIQRHAKNGDPGDKEISNIGNPLFQSVHKHWPSLEIRFQATAMSFVGSMGITSGGARRHLALLLASLLGVFSSLSDLCTDFLAKKFNDGIWPHLAKLFTHVLRKLDNNEDRSKYTVFSGTETDLILSILNCVKQMYSSDVSRVILSSSTSTVGTMVLPLLSVNGEIGESAMNVIRALLQVDCDCLWRALRQASGTMFPARPLKPKCILDGERPNKTSRAHKDEMGALMAKRATSLITFSLELTEQDLL